MHKVSRQALPEVDAEFIERFGVEGGDEAKFRAEIKKNMTREAAQAVDNRVKQQVLDALKKPTISLFRARSFNRRLTA